MKAIVFMDDVSQWGVIELLRVSNGDYKVKWWWGGDKGWMLNIGSSELFRTSSDALNAMGRAHHTEPKTSYQNAVVSQPAVDLRTLPSSGWSCPRCTRIYGPTVQICVPCNTLVAAKENA